MQEELDRIETEMQNTQATVASFSNVEADYLGMLEIIQDYLRNPYKVWEKAHLTEKLKLQWFEFPFGIVYQDKKLRTTQVANIFKAKSANSRYNSHRVDYPVESTNRIPKKPYAVKKPFAEFGKSRKEDNQVYWNKVGEELVKLSSIITDIKNGSVSKIDS